MNTLNNLVQAAEAGPLLRVSGITKTFQGIHAIENVSFDVAKGHIKALLGPNGAGKTTMLNVINGFLTPNAGEVLLKGQRITNLRTDKIAARGISRTFQLIRLFTVNNATVLDNVMLGGHGTLKPSIVGALFLRGRTARRQKEVRERAMELLDLVGLAHLANEAPGSLSFGNQRLVELARSLMSGPELLLLDEPASGLNDAEVEEFADLLRTIRKMGTTLLLVEHNMKLVMSITDDIVVIDFGRWLAEGDPASICANPAVIAAYLGAENPHEGWISKC